MKGREVVLLLPPSPPRPRLSPPSNWSAEEDAEDGENEKQYEERRRIGIGSPLGGGRFRSNKQFENVHFAVRSSAHRLIKLGRDGMEWKSEQIELIRIDGFKGTICS